ncbi:MAG: hypothetical protein HKN43_11155 [Rhodothermales bacterium]|nr:hypothetical protein [Rhodothermales bacterium]
MPDRKYGHDEIQRILKKATEKQQKAHEVSRPEVGLSIEEIERIASEAGIDPKFVREAAWESKTLDDDRKHSWLLGGMTSMKVERSIPAEVPRSLLDTELVPVIREQSGKTGQFEKLGESPRGLTTKHPGPRTPKYRSHRRTARRILWWSRPKTSNRHRMLYLSSRR